MTRATMQMAQDYLGRIKELEKENAELKDALKGKKCNCMTYLNFKDLEKELTKAKEILKELAYMEYAINPPADKVRSLMVKAEKFLKEIKENE